MSSLAMAEEGEMESVLKRYFGYSQFRANQKQIIEQILSGRDVLVVMATGSGKSVCYQIPPLVAGKTAVVISPLISLMQDQVMCLTERGIRAQYLGSTQNDQYAVSKAKSGHFDVLYMTPEKASSVSNGFWSSMLSKGISLLAIDEAHCISEWGHDFRKEYKQMHLLRRFLPGVPFVALTATATKKVQEDIRFSLDMKDPFVVTGSFDRPNLYYAVHSFSHTASFREGLVREVSKYATDGASTIIYCTTIEDAKETFTSLKDAGIKTGLYHGKMSSKAREESHRSFVRDEVIVMVATVAFGMGIDKPDIRCVIHYGCPKSLESYYQESGRCGRDGLPSKCVLYYTRADFVKGHFYSSECDSAIRRQSVMDSFLAAQKYCMLTTCRRISLLAYFGEKATFDNCGNCDNCMMNSGERTKDMSREVYILLKTVQSCGCRWGINMPVDVLRGSRAKKIMDNHFEELPTHGLGRDHSANWWKGLGDLLIAQGYLAETVTDIYRVVRVSRTGADYLNAATDGHQPPLMLIITSEMMAEEGSKSGGNFGGNPNSISTFKSGDFSADEMKLYQMLLDLRLMLARKSGTAPYAICSDQTITRLAKVRPSTKARLANIDGINLSLVTTYGEDILQNINHMSKNLNLHLDGEAPIMHGTSTCEKKYGSQRPLAPAKLETWKMWHENGLSLEEIANFPDRPSPIKQDTVIEYMLEAIREGYAVDWGRFCKEIGLSVEIMKAIEDAINKVGSRERMKPIKSILPDTISYEHIKTCFLLLDLGVKAADVFGSQASNMLSNSTDEVKRSCEEEKMQVVKELSSPSVGNNNNHDNTNHGESFSDVDVELVQLRKQARDNDSSRTEVPPKSRRRTRILAPEATEAAILDWLGDHQLVSLPNIVDHFTGSEEEFVIDLLNHLESDFLIFKKNGLYSVM